MHIFTCYSFRVLIATYNNRTNQNVNMTPLTPAEAEALTKDLQAVLLKHNAEISVQSTLQLVRHVDTAEEVAPDAPENGKS